METSRGVTGVGGHSLQAAWSQLYPRQEDNSLTIGERPFLSRAVQITCNSPDRLILWRRPPSLTDMQRAVRERGGLDRTQSVLCRPFFDDRSPLEMNVYTY